MSKTLRDIVSELATDIKSLNLDDRISFRYLANKFNSKLDYFLRLEFKSREFANQQDIWKPIDCVNFKEVNTNGCNFIDRCTTLYRSVCQIPEPYNTNYGLLLKVLTIDGRREYKLISKSSDYQDYINRRWKGNLRPVYLEDHYLYIPDIYTEAVKLLVIATSLHAVDKCRACSSGKSIECINPLDTEVPYPPYLITLAKQEVYKELLSRENVREDEKGDDNTNRKD